MGKKKVPSTVQQADTNPAWGLAPSRGMKLDVSAKNDPTGMRRSGLNFQQALMDAQIAAAGIDPNLRDSDIGEYNKQLNNRGIAGSRSMFDPYSGGSDYKLPKKFKGSLEDYVRQTAPAALDEYQDYMNKYGQWKGQYTNANLDSQIRNFEKGLPPLQFLGGQDSVVNRINTNLSAYGISDLGQIGARQNAQGGVEYFNRNTGQLLPNQIMHFKSNTQGTLRVRLAQGPDGQVYLHNDFEGPHKQFGDYMGDVVLASLAGLAGGAMAPAMGAAVGSTTGAGATTSAIAGQALAQGTVQGALAAADGGNAGKAFLMGAASGGIGAGVNAANPAGYMGVSNPVLSSGINKGISGALTGGIGSRLNGGSFRDGAVQGGMSGVTSGLISGALGQMGMGGQFANTVGGMAGKYAAQGSPRPQAGQTRAPGTQGTTATAQGMQGATMGPLSQMRDLNISWLPQDKQQNIRNAFDKMNSWGAPGLDNVRLV